MRKYLPHLLVGVCVLIFLPSLFVFFSTDDWFHLRVSQIGNIGEFLNFFSFVKTPQSIAFYRPLPTQVFFFAFQKLFGLNPLPYHLFVIAAFTLSLYLVYKLAHELLKDNKKALLAIFIYAFSVSNFTRLYFLSAFQEIALVVFALLTIRKRSPPFFVLALLSKETAVVLPVILLVLDWSRKKINLKKFLPFILILVPYLYFRLFIFGGAVGDTYIWNLSPVKAVNTLIWYILWSVGAPELLVDYIGSGFRPIPRFFTDYPVWWATMIGLLISTATSLAYLLIKKVKQVDRKLLTFITLFIVSLGPVIFLPQHKFALELGLPLIWFSLAISWLLPQKGKVLTIFIFFYLALNLSMNYLTYTRHYSVQRGKISKNLYKYLTSNYPSPPKDAYFEFINDTGDYGVSWGSSKQIANTIGGSELFRVLYHDPSYIVFYEDFPGERPKEKTKIPLSTKMFIK